MSTRLSAVGKTAIGMAAAAALMPGQAANVSWSTLADGFWDIAGNWTPTPPAAGDNVTINVAGQRTVTFRTGTLTIASLALTNNTLDLTGGALTVSGSFAHTGTGITRISGGSLALNGASTLASFAQSSGSLAGTGTVTVSGPAALTFGDHRGTGTTILQGASTIGSSGLRLDGGRILRNEGTLTWNGGQLLFNNTFNGVSGGAGSGTLSNVATGTFIVSGDGATSIAASNFGGTDTGADAAINNAGTFRKSGSGATHTTTVDVAFNNTGTVQVQTGVLNLSNGGTHTGSFDVAAGGVLGFGGGTHSLNGGGITSPGTVRLSGAAIVNVNAGYNIAGTTEIQNGSFNLLAGSATTGALIQSSGSVSGTGNFTVSGAAAITFGDHRGAGTTVLQGASTISSSGLRLDGGRILRNEGTLTWNGGQLLFNNTFNGVSGGAGSGTINNAATGTFIASGDGATSIAASNFGGTDTGADAAINNAGIFRKSGSGTAHTTTVGVAFNNSGTVQVQTGILNLSNGGTHTGSFDVAAGSVLGFGGGTHSLNGGGITSPGSVRLSGTAIVNVNAGYSIAGITEIQGGSFNLLAGSATTGALIQSSGSVSGTNNFNVSGAAAITFGDHRGTGTTILQGASTISSSGLRLDGGRILRNEGTLTWNGGQLLFNNTFNGVSGGAGSGTINNAAAGTFIASGDGATSIAASNFGGTDTGADAAINNAGTFRKSGSGAANTTTVDVAFNNSGTLQVQTGVLSFTDGSTQAGAIQIDNAATLRFGGGTHTFNTATTNIAGRLELTTGELVFNVPHTITGTGSFDQSSGTVRGADLTFASGANFSFGDHRGAGTTILQGVSTITSSGLRLDGGRVLRNEGTLTWSGGQLLFNNTFNGVSGGAGSGTINNAATGSFIVSGDGATSIAASNFGGTDTGADAAINNAGTFRKSGSGAASTTTVGVAFNNSGLVQASTGVLSFSNGLGGTTGTLQIDSAGAIALGQPSTTGTLLHNGTGVGSLSLGANTLTVSVDYNNANFGSGNAFNRRAGVASTGAGNRLVAAGNANQGVTGSGVSNGSSATPGLVIGNVHVGATTFGYAIQNTGSSGPALRGAIQTSVNGGNITDARLSGSGVTAGNWGPLATGASLAREVVLDVATAGVYTPLSGQAVSIVNNFDNTRSQVLTIGSAAGAAAYNLAAAAAVTPNPLTLANQRVGGSTSAALTVTNSAPAGSFTEGLNASFGALTGAALTNGGAISLLAGGASNNSALAVRVDTSSAGAKTGSVAVNLVSDGSGSSGLGTTPLAAQVINVSGNVYRLANPTLDTPSITLAARVGDASPSATVGLTNSSPDLFTERLNAGFGTVTAGFTGSGSVTGLAAGASSNALTVSLNTTAPASISNGSATLNLVSSGSGTTGAPDAALAAQSVALNGRVYAPAVAQVNTATVDFGIVHKGDSVAARSVSITNAATAAPANDTLRGTIATASAPFSASGTLAGVAAQATDTTSFAVGLNTAAAGVFNGTATASFISHNSELADLGLAPVSVVLRGQVNNFAEAGFSKTGAGTLSQAGGRYTLDFGSVVLGSGSPTADLKLFNSAIGPADLLSGSFDLAGIGSAFTLTGFGSFAGLTAGSSLDNLGVVFSGASLGTFSSSLVFHATGSNASGYAGALADTTLVFTGTVVAVPEPGTYLLMVVGLFGVLRVARARRAATAA